MSVSGDELDAAVATQRSVNRPICWRYHTGTRIRTTRPPIRLPFRPLPYARPTASRPAPDRLSRSDSELSSSVPRDLKLGLIPIRPEARTHLKHAREPMKQDFVARLDG